MLHKILTINLYLILRGIIKLYKFLEIAAYIDFVLIIIFVVLGHIHYKDYHYIIQLKITQLMGLIGIIIIFLILQDLKIAKQYFPVLIV